MKKTILIADDSELNLELIVSLLQKYTHDNNEDIDILEAHDGQEVIDLCTTHPVDLIFMDIIMPIVDGNKATKIIKSQYPNIMVIVVSSLGDEEHKKEMLENGAEDYITKPLIASVFNSRLHNYMQLLQHKNHATNNRAKAYNLFSSKIYNYHMDFLILSEEDLSEFWEAMLIRFNFHAQVKDISQLVHFAYSLGNLQLNNKFKFHIIVEENSEYMYFTFTNIRLLGCKKIEILIKKYFLDAQYLCQDNHLSFSLSKELTHSHKQTEVRTKESIIDASPTHVVLQTYNIIDDEELDELEEYLVKIKSIIILMQNGSIDTEEIDYFCNYLRSIASILSISNDSYVISNSLKTLSDAVMTNIEYFEEHASMLYEFTNAFINDLIFWKTKIFYEGAPSIDFLNDSIVTNANMLNSLLSPSNETEENLEDIFDF